MVAPAADAADRGLRTALTDQRRANGAAERHGGGKRDQAGNVKLGVRMNW